MERLRRVLVERYIGLVMVCAFLYEGVLYGAYVLRYPFEELVRYFYNAHRPADTFALNSLGPEPWWLTTYQFVVLLIDLLLAILLYRWLYPNRGLELAALDSSGRENS